MMGSTNCLGSIYGRIWKVWRQQVLKGSVVGRSSVRSSSGLKDRRKGAMGN